MTANQMVKFSCRLSGENVFDLDVYRSLVKEFGKAKSKIKTDRQRVADKQRLDRKKDW